jgi:hypothetical protein
MATAMRLVRGDPDYTAATALLAVHSAISFNDAVLVKLNGASFHGQDHRQAAEITKRKCAERELDFQGVRHLRELVGNKAYVSYGDENVPPQKVERLCEAAERFRA